MTRWKRLTKEQAKKLGIDEGTWELMHIEEEESADSWEDLADERRNADGRKEDKS